MKGSFEKRITVVGLVVTAVAFFGARVLADSAHDIETYEGMFNAASNTVTWDGGSSGSEPVITSIVSQPGHWGQRSYSTWAFLAADSTGSMDVYTYTDTLFAVSGGTYTSPQIGDAVNMTGFWIPYHQIPEINFSTVVGHGNSLTYLPNTITLVSSLNNIPATKDYSNIAPLNVGTLPLSEAGYWTELDGVTISGFNGTTFPNSNVAAQITDSFGNTMTLYFWPSSYSTDGNMVFSPIPTGPVTIYGFSSVYSTTTPEFIPIIIPEPSTVMLVVAGLFGLLAIRRRRS